MCTLGLLPPSLPTANQVNQHLLATDLALQNSLHMEDSLIYSTTVLPTLLGQVKSHLTSFSSFVKTDATMNNPFLRVVLRLNEIFGNFLTQTIVSCYC